jgi:hypothetical protein
MKIQILLLYEAADDISALSFKVQIVQKNLHSALLTGRQATKFEVLYACYSVVTSYS